MKRSVLLIALLGLFAFACTQEEEVLDSQALFEDQCGDCIDGEQQCTRDDGTFYSIPCRDGGNN